MEQLLEEIQKEVVGVAITGSNAVVWHTTPGLITDENEIGIIIDSFKKDSKTIFLQAPQHTH